MFEEVISVKGKVPGPTSLILAGVHGDEKCGPEALAKILPTLQIERGEVLFAYGNPRALAANRRFTEANLNRLFKDPALLSETEKGSYEYGRAQFLKTYLDQADYLLDLHASFTLESPAFIIAEAKAQSIVPYLPAQIVLSGLAEIHAGATDYYLNRQGKIGICLECGYLGDPAAVQVAEAGIYAFLKARGHLANDLVPRLQTYLEAYDLYLTKTADFRLAKTWADFESVKVGQIIGWDGEQAVTIEKDGFVLFAKNCNQIGAETFVLAKNKNSPA